MISNRLNMQSTNKIIIRNFVVEVWNNSNFDKIEEFIHKDYIAHRLSSKTALKGITGVRRNVENYKNKYPNLKIIIKDMICEGNKVSSRIIIKDGQKSMNELIIYRISNNKIIESWSIGSN